ncbi:hypothetical protein [Micromonospora sp. NPDC005174]
MIPPLLNTVRPTIHRRRLPATVGRVKPAQPTTAATVKENR